MKLSVLLWLFAICAMAASKSESCKSETQEECESLTSEYETYRACMERRTKRAAECDDVVEDIDCDDSCSSSSCSNCNDCTSCSSSSCNSCDDCKSCSSSSCNNCNDCSSCSSGSCANCKSNCCRQKSTCTTHACCHKTCHAECKSNACRTQCKKKCQNRIIEQREETKNEITSNHNITTVIHLNNMINNTNLINLPISVNNTIWNSQNQTSGGSCCQTVGPRQCVPQKQFPFMRCFHIRRRACGNICTAPVVHYQKHEICDNDLNVNVQQPCRQQIVYVPQPQPRCAYTPSWPYVSCGNRQLQTCDGCYSHYIRRDDISRCSSFCYDDGYGAGPYYRQGPFYRPGLAHAPSCLQTGDCNDYGYGYGGGYDGFLPQTGFPIAYPPQSYPFAIEDCDNCSFPNPDFNQINWINSNKSPSIELGIDRSVRSERYAEIRIKTESEEVVTTTESSSNTE